MKNRLLLVLLVITFFVGFNVQAKDYTYYIDNTCGIDEEDCYKTLDEALETVKDDKTTASDGVYLNFIDNTASISKSYTINARLKFVIDDVPNRKFEFNGNNNTITTGKFIEITGNSEITLSNLNIKDTLASAENYSFTLSISNNIASLNSLSVTSLKYMGIMIGDTNSEYELDSVQVSGAEVGIDYLGKTFSINNSTIDDNTMGFTISCEEANIVNSKINSIRAYDNTIVNVNSNNSLPNKELMFLMKDDSEGYLDVDLDKYFVVSSDSSSKIKMKLVKDTDIILNKKNNKIDIFKLFNGVVDVEASNVEWKSSNEEVASIKDGFVILNRDGEATVSGLIPNTDTTLSVNFRVSNEPDNSFGGKVKNIVSNPKTYSSIFVLSLFVLVITGTLLIYKRSKLDMNKEDIL